MKKNNNLGKILVIILIAFVLVNGYFLFSNFKILKNISLNNNTLELNNNYFENITELKLTSDPLSLSKFTKVSISVKDNNILLENNCTVLTIETNEYQKYSIEQGLKYKIDVRPTTHDIMSDVLNNFNVSLIQAKITENSGMHYFARTIYKQNNKILNIDTKASDAVAIAVRMHVPIYVKSELFYNLGKKVC